MQEIQSNPPLWLFLVFENVSSWTSTVFVMHWSDDWTLLNVAKDEFLLGSQNTEGSRSNTCSISTKVLMEPSFLSLSSGTTDLTGCSSSKQSANTYKSFWLNNGEYQRAGTPGHSPRPPSLWATVWKRSKQILQGLPQGAWSMFVRTPHMNMIWACSKLAHWKRHRHISLEKARANLTSAYSLMVMVFWSLRYVTCLGSKDREDGFMCEHTMGGIMRAQ